MTVDTENQSPQALEGDDSLMTVDDSDDSSTLNEAETELVEYSSSKLQNSSQTQNKVWEPFYK